MTRRHGPFAPYADDGSALCPRCKRYVRLVHDTRRFVRQRMAKEVPIVTVTVNA
jgi:hypothetical protein